MKRAALLVAAVAVFVALGLIRWSGRGATPEFARGGERSGAEARDASSPLTDVGDDASVRSPLQASIHNAEQSSPATAAKQRGFEIIVVDAASQSPVAGAEIFVADVPQSDSLRDELLQRLDELIPSIETEGTRYRSDERGRVQLLSRSPHTVVYGHVDGRRGMVRVHPYMKRQAVLALHADFDVTVQVVDPSGVPLAGVSVALAFGNEQLLQEGEIAITTGAGALGTLHHVGLALALNENGRGFAALAGLFDPPICVALDGLHPPSQPVVLVAPASGELEVLARHADGTPDLDSTWVRVQVMRATPDPLEEPLSNAWIGVMHEARVVVPRVPLGCRFQAALYRNGSGMPVYGATNGPVRSGERETLVVDSDTAEHAQLIVARVLDEAGQPIASTQVMIGLGTEEQGTGVSYGVRTARSGRFRFHVPDQSSGPPPTRVLIAERNRVPRGGYVSFAQVPLRTGLSPEVTDLGDIVLTAGASLVAGRVMDGQGAPVSDAHVSIAHEGAWTGFWPSSMRARSDAAGHFEVRGMCTAERLFVCAEVEGARSARTEFHPGASDVALVVERTGEIAGVIRLTPPLETRELSIRARREDQKELGEYAADSEFGGAFRFDELAPGTYRVIIRLNQEEREVLSIADLRVIGGEVLRPPELDPLDLTNSIHLHRVTARNADGRSLPDLTVTWRAAGQPPSDADPCVYFPDGQVRMVSVHDNVDADVAAERMRMTHVEDLAGEREITMASAVRVRIVLLADAPLPDAPFKLAPILVATAQSSDRKSWDAQSFSSTRDSYVSARESGPREVHFALYKGDEWTPDAEIHPAVPQIVTIADEPAEQTFEVTISEAELRRAIAAYPQ